MSAAKKQILIIGGGAAGSKVASTLSTKLDASKHSITLVDSRPFHAFLIATIRLVVDPADPQGAFVPFDKLFSKGHGRFVQGKAVSVTPSKVGQSGSVQLEDGQSLPYDVLVLAPGYKWAGPLGFPDKQEDVTAFVNEQRTKFERATGYVIIGAGAVGAEFAGEIRDLWPNKKITVVHGGSVPLNDVYPAKFRNAVNKSLKARKIDIIYNDYIDTVPESDVKSVTTRNGTVIQADLVINARGPRPNTELFKTFAPETLTSAGLVRVEKTQQLEGHPNIFVAGDVVDVVEQKQWVKAVAHGVVVANNVVALLAGKPATAEYKGSSEMIFVPNGRNGGAGYLAGFVVGDWIVRMGKAKTLMVGMGRAAMNYTS